MTQLHSAIEKVIQQRLEESQIFIDGSLLSDNIKKLAETKKESQTEKLEYIHKLCQSSFTVSDEDMVHALTLKLVKNEPKKMALGSSHFYIRSLKIAVKDMNVVLEQYENLYNDNKFTSFWKGALSNKSGESTIFLRYIGTTFRSPYERSQDNDSSMQTRRVNFETIVKNILPENSTFSIFGIPLLCIEKSTSFTIHQKLVDIVEICLIHLFGRECILNSQPGGKFVNYLPNKKDMDTIMSLNLQLVLDEEHSRKKSKTLKSPMNEEYSEINNIYNTYYRKLVKENDDDEITAKLTSRYIDILVSQVTCNAFSIGKKITPLVLFGSIIPESEFNDCISYLLNDNSRSSMHIRQLLDNINQLAYKPLASTTLPFLDLYLIPKMINESLHITIAAHLLQNLGAVIIATFGYEPAAAAYSNFHGSQSLSKLAYREKIGEPVIVNLDTDFDYNSPSTSKPKDIHSIMISNIDPSYPYYDSVDPKLLRLMYLIMARTFLLLDCILKCIEEDMYAKINSKSFCEKALNLWNTRANETQLSSLFNDAKIEWYESISETLKGRHVKYLKRTIDSDDVDEKTELSARFSNTTNKKINEIGYTIGSKNSDERHEQMMKIRRYNHSQLSRHPNYNNENKWKSWFMNLSKGVSIMQASLVKTQEYEYNPIGNLRRKDVKFLKQSLQVLDGWTEKDIELLKYDEDLVQQLKDDRAAHMRSSPKYTESLKNRIKGPQIEKRSNITSTFIMHPVTISASKAKINVMIDDKLAFNEFGIFFAGKPQNDKQVVYYEDKKSGEIKPYSVSDSYLLKYCKDSYLQIFKETVKQCGQILRPSIEHEETFEEEHVAKYIWKKVSFNGKGSMYTDRNSDDDNSLHILILNALSELNSNEEEKIWWMDVIENPVKNAKIANLFKKIVGSDNFQIERQKYGRMWTLPKYHE
ncbi:unnamed protein product [Cunninghamella blakesleeana]